MSSAIRIRVLGGFTVHKDGEAVTMPPSKKTRALLAYLAVEPRAHRRERLCELFWGIPDDPRGALRWSLSKLRQFLTVDGELLLKSDRHVVQLTRNHIELDYELIRNVSPDALDALPTPTLETMARAFAGAFIEDLQLPRCPEFEAWRTYHASRAELIHLKALRCLADRLTDQPERALNHLHTLQALLPDEDFSARIEATRLQIRQSIADVPFPGVGADRRTADASGALSGADRPAPPVPPSRPVQFCRSRDGARIAYAVDGNGPAIVRAAHWMSHIGLERESPVWIHWLNAISRDFSLIRYDERLNGLSEQVVQDVSFEALVADLESVVEAAVPGQRFLLLGISQGCPVAIDYAVRYPERIAGLILHGGFVRGWRARGDASEIARREAMQVLMREGWGQNDPAFRQLFTSLFIPGANPRQMESFNELQRLTVTPENAARLSEVFSGIDVSEQLGRLDVPTLVLHARDDRIAPLAGGLELTERIKGARMVELDSRNHILLPEEPAFHRFFSEVSQFAREVLAKPAVSISSRRRYPATVLCAQLVSPIQALSHVDPEAPLDLIDPLLIGAAELIRRNGGTVIELSDDNVVASFDDGTGDHAATACRTALALRDQIRRDSRALARIRMALDTGTVIATPPRISSARAEVELRGPPVTTAKSVNQSLRRELVVVTDRTLESAGSALQTRQVQKKEIVGFSLAQRLFELTGVASGDAIA